MIRRLLLTALFLPACGGVFGGGDFGCDKRSSNPSSCTDISIPTGGNASLSKSACEQEGGTVLDACPREMTLGGCELVNIVWYYENPSRGVSTVDDVKQLCVDTASTFVAP